MMMYDDEDDYGDELDDYGMEEGPGMGGQQKMGGGRVLSPEEED